LEIFFIGVGEACDGDNGNTSVLVTTRDKTRILLDCGFSVPHHFFHFDLQTPDLDYIWISHFHGDHYFGLPLLFLRLWQEGRTKPLTIVSQQGVADKVLNLLDIAYPSFREKFSFSLKFHTIEADTTTTIGGLQWAATQTGHSQYNLGLLLDDGTKKIYYSGDGRPNKQVEHLIRGCDLVVHEAFTLVDEFPYHGSITSCLELAKRTDISNMALLHLDRHLRRDGLNDVFQALEDKSGIILPSAGDQISLA